MVDDDDDRGANYGVEDDGTTLKIYLTILSQIPRLKALMEADGHVFCCAIAIDVVNKR